MPTPMPIIAATSGPNSGIVNPFEAMAITAAPTPRPNNAVVTGKPIAITEPKAMSRMMTAASKPRISALGQVEAGEQLTAVLDAQDTA